MNFKFKTLDKWDVSFQEVPNEISLNISIIQCCHNCKGCSWNHLIRDCTINPEKYKNISTEMIEKYKICYNDYLTCICIYGGDYDLNEFKSLLLYLKSEFKDKKIAWYTGLSEKALDSLSSEYLDNLDYIKFGEYDESRGSLDCKTTNQKFFKKQQNKWVDSTFLFWK